MSVYPSTQIALKPPTSPGTCFICKEKTYGNLIEGHLDSCLQLLPRGQAKGPGLLIRIMDKRYRRFWLMILACPEATLGELDDLLRDVWFSSSHLSAFTISHMHFSSHNEDGGMNVCIRDVLQLGDEATYEYDFRYASTLRIQILKTVLHCPADKNLILLGQNKNAHHRCKECKNKASYAYYKNGTENATYYCSACVDAPHINFEYCSPLANSPRPGARRNRSDGDARLSWYPE